MKKSLSLLIILLTLFLTACGGQAQSITGNYAGQVEGTNGEQLMAFYCDGTTEAPPELWGWFRGDLNGNTFDLTNENGDHLTGEFSSNRVSGTITPANGSALNFQAKRVDEPAGLYRNEEIVDGVETLSGWILLANQELRGGKRSGNQLNPAPVPPVGWIDPDSQPVQWVDPDSQP